MPCADARAQTHVGRIRSQNQDAVISDPARGLFLVADGMGGHVGGEVAAGLAIAACHRRLVQGSFLGRPDGWLHTAIGTANGEVWSHGAERPDLRGMGTTLVAAMLLPDGRLWIGHVGDSRAYLFRGGRALLCLTQDHGYGHILERAIGLEPTVQADVTSVRLRRGDRILLCTDGLTKPVSDTRIQSALARAPDCTRAADALVQLALRAGGPDNVTVLVAEFG